MKSIRLLLAVLAAICLAPGAHAQAKNPRVFFDVTADGRALGRIVIELRADVVPKTAENFRALATGEKGYGYKGGLFYKVLPNAMAESGDDLSGKALSGTAGIVGKSIYGPTFADENFTLKHAAPGVVGMANRGPGTNNSVFYITAVATPWLDGKNVVVGSVVSGMDVVAKLNALGTDKGKPRARLQIENAGQL